MFSTTTTKEGRSVKGLMSDKFFLTGVPSLVLAVLCTCLLFMAINPNYQGYPGILLIPVSLIVWLAVFWPTFHRVLVVRIGSDNAAFIKPYDAQAARLVLQSPTNLRLWRWDRRLDGADIISIKPQNHESFVWMNVRPITSNPGVREIKYWVKVQCSTPEQLITMWNGLGLQNPGCMNGSQPHGYNEVKDTWLTSKLYDFNEKRRHELSAFFNPLKPEQQQQFRQLLQDFLAPELQRTGLTLVDARFTEV